LKKSESICDTRPAIERPNKTFNNKINPPIPPLAKTSGARSPKDAGAKIRGANGDILNPVIFENI
jgi:hypothetical protein